MVIVIMCYSYYVQLISLSLVFEQKRGCFKTDLFAVNGLNLFFNTNSSSNPFCSFYKNLYLTCINKFISRYVNIMCVLCIYYHYIIYHNFSQLSDHLSHKVLLYFQTKLCCAFSVFDFYHAISISPKL